MKRLALFARPYIFLLIMASFTCAGCAIVNVWVVDIFRGVIDESISGNISNITFVIIEGIGAVLIGIVCNYLVIYSTQYFGANILRDMRKSAVDSLSKMSIEYVDNSNYGDMIARMTSDIDTIAMFMEGYFKECMYVPILIVVFSGYLFYMNWLLALVCLISLVFLVPLSIKLMDPIKRSQFEYTKKLANTNNNVQEVCDGIVAVKSYNLEKKLEEKYYADLHKTLEISYVNDRRQYNAQPISQLISELPVTLALCVGGYLVFRGQLTIGVLVAFVSLIKKLIEPLNSAYQIIVRGKMAMINADRVFEVLEAPVEENCETNSVIDRECQQIFDLNNVGFSYNGVIEQAVLHNINLVINKGEKVAFVGRSGGGKSTLLKLLYKHYNVSSGTIKYCGINYNMLNPNQLRNDMSLISQDVFLFPMSIADNIRVGRPDVTMEQIVNASKAAYCHEFVMELPNGYDTFVGEKGTLLSGGQKQRISIARAILKNAPVILLDEPTSALDKQSEKLVNEALDRVTVNKTVIVVAHRMTTIVNSDNIVVVDDGIIKEQGKHDDLMRNNGLYSELYNEYVGKGIIE